MSHPFTGIEACADMDREIFFVPDKMRGAPKRRYIANAVAICNTCPIMDACLSYAKDQNGTVGVWGGQEFDGLGFVSVATLTGKTMEVAA